MPLQHQGQSHRLTACPSCHHTQLFRDDDERWRCSRCGERHSIQALVTVEKAITPLGDDGKYDEKPI